MIVYGGQESNLLATNTASGRCIRFKPVFLPLKPEVIGYCRNIDHVRIKSPEGGGKSFVPGSLIIAFFLFFD